MTIDQCQQGDPHHHHHFIYLLPEA